MEKKSKQSRMPSSNYVMYAEQDNFFRLETINTYLTSKLNTNATIAARLRCFKNLTQPFAST